MQTTDLISLREALEASWESDTANLKMAEKGNPALGQCYPASRVVQHFFPDSEIVEGEVLTPHGSIEKHFWNVLKINGREFHIDFTWQQFPHGSRVKSWKIRDRRYLNDRKVTIQRTQTLLNRVENYL